MLVAKINGVEEADEAVADRRLRDLRRIAAKLRRSGMKPIQICEGLIKDRVLDAETKSFFRDLAEDEKHYWVASLYALLMSTKRRRKLAAYFTPPHLAHYVVELVCDAGVEPGRHRILDPASGGAAFLGPLAARIAKLCAQRGASCEKVLQTVESTLAGVEIDPDLGRLSKLVLFDLLKKEIVTAGRKPRISIQEADTLKLAPPKDLYDAIVANPPYGRILRPSSALRSGFSGVISHGYVNLYALFIEQALRWVKPDGVICLVVPMSFIGGPYFAALRKRILETCHVVRLDPIDKRSDVFLDVLYDVCVLVLRRRGALRTFSPPASSLLIIGQPNRPLGSLDLPQRTSDRIWALPDSGQSDGVFQPGFETLQDYGYIAKTGYFVWNREQHRYRVGYKPRSNEVPLFWAHNITANKISIPHDGEQGSSRIGFVKVEPNSTAIISSDAVVLQRTSNRRQKRRIIAGIIRQSTVQGSRGCVTENHTIVVIPDPAKTQALPLGMLCRLLNTAAVDKRFRRVSGSVSVSTKALAQLPLPAAKQVKAACANGIDDERAIEVAYSRSKLSVAKEMSARAGT